VSDSLHSEDKSAVNDCVYSAPRLDREGWRLKLPEKPPLLSDDRLLEYRHPAEHRMLILALVLLAILLAAAVKFKEWDLLLAIGAIYLSMLVLSLQAVTLNTLNGAEVTPTQFPDVYRMVQDLGRRFHAPPTRVFVLREQSLVAQPLGIRAPYVIVLPHALMDALEPQELAYEVGKALGHICFGHTRMALLFGGEGSQLPAPLAWIAKIRDLIFAGYWRAQVLTGDRAGVLACGGIENALRARVKLSVGSNQSREVQADDLIEQAFKLTQGTSMVGATLIHWQSSTPPFIYRLEAMVEWAGLPSAESEAGAIGHGR
jgi:Zn-dependent protease with chaperone function